MSHPKKKKKKKKKVPQYWVCAVCVCECVFVCFSGYSPLCVCVCVCVCALVGSMLLNWCLLLVFCTRWELYTVSEAGGAGGSGEEMIPYSNCSACRFVQAM